MGIFNKLHKIDKLHKAIKREYQGNSQEYAKHISVSRSALFCYIDELKEMGAQIIYCQSSRCYKYLNNFEFEYKLKFDVISSDEMKKIQGGSKKFSPVLFFRLRNVNFANNKKNRP